MKRRMLVLQYQRAVTDAQSFFLGGIILGCSHAFLPVSWSGYVCIVGAGVCWLGWWANEARANRIERHLKRGVKSMIKTFCCICKRAVETAFLHNNVLCEECRKKVAKCLLPQTAETRLVSVMMNPVQTTNAAGR